MNRKLPTYSRAVFYARLTLAVVLLAAFVCTTVPLASVSAGNVCRLECCAGRAPHAAGSCMNGTCHAAIQLHKNKLRRSPEVGSAEELCGLKRLSKRLSYRATSTDAATPQKSVATLSRTCDADCAKCAAGAASAKGKITMAGAYRLQPLRTTWSIDSDSVSPNETFNRRHSPRGPPTDLS